MGAIGTAGVLVCNYVLPRAAEEDREIEVNLSFENGLLAEVLWRSTQMFIVLQPMIMAIFDFDQLAVWLCGFFTILPLILSWDLQHNRPRRRPMPAIFDRFKPD